MASLIYITIGGGMVNDVHASDPNTKVIVLDHDVTDTDEQERLEEKCKILDQKIKDREVTEVY